MRLADGELVERPPATRSRSLPVHPTQLYSAINAALTSWLLWAWFPHRRRDGEVALLMFTLYPVSRFLLEIIRTDEGAIFGTGLSISQNVSLGVLAAAAVGWVLLSRTRPAGRCEKSRRPSRRRLEPRRRPRRRFDVRFSYTLVSFRFHPSGFPSERYASTRPFSAAWPPSSPSKRFPPPPSPKTPVPLKRGP